uniref:Sodium/potassium-transporting ATPase subunit beta n=1 Tax=Denticeps clupeoides TaxID=299321 RepID=A0AAY4CEW0_9TELE
MRLASQQDKPGLKVSVIVTGISLCFSLTVYISLYYVAFYIVMTGLFALSIYVLMYTLDPYEPDYQDRLHSPGKRIPVDIFYNMSDQHKGFNQLNQCHPVLAYNDTTQTHTNHHSCTQGHYFFQKKFEAPGHTKWACPFTQSMLGNCSGLEDPSFGYNGSEPCVIIKMNRIINFLPNNGTGMAPYVNCTVLVSMEYFPKNGTLDLSYFPYYGRKAQPTYINPLVAVKIHLVQEREAKIQCRVVAHNIAYQNFYDPYEGKVIFHIRASS